MKKNIYITISCLLASLCLMCGNATAMQVDSLTRAEINQAISLARGSKGKIDREKAFGVLQKYAGEGIPRAMNGLGLMYILGHVSEPDAEQGIRWLTKAGEAGYSSAWNNLGNIYKYARAGEKQDMHKAYAYFEKAVEAGNPAGYYMAGYMLYKGLGCEQDYEKAFRYFEEGAAKDYSPAMYMLGLCYRNGYGVAKSNGNAQFWLAEADRKAYKFATDEMEMETPENSFDRRQLRSSQMIAVPLRHAQVKHLDPGTSINGTFEGLLVTYDWSGKNIIRETPVKLNLTSDGENITGEWIENETDTVSVQAVQANDKLTFIDTRQYRTDHYTQDSPVLFNFENAAVQIVNDHNSTSLTGNIRMYSPETMEPERPMYLSLRKADAETSLTAETVIKGMKAYPVPFTNELNISFWQEEEANVRIGIYNYSGQCAYMYEAGKLPVGEQHLQLSPALDAGTYIVKLFCGNKASQVVVISNGSKL